MSARQCPDKTDRRAFLQTGATLIGLHFFSQLTACTGENRNENAEDKKIYDDPKFELLDLALQHEYGAVVQYGNHAGVISAIGQDANNSIKRKIRNIVNQEVHHAILLTSILQKNNIQPSVAVWPPQTAPTAKEMLTKDIATETGAIELYQQILDQDFDSSTKKTVERIIRSEERHHSMFSEILSELA